MKVESAQAYPTGKKSKIIKIVVSIEPIRAINELSITVLSLHHLIDEIKGWHTG